MPLTIALPRECRGGERRVGLVPAAVARLIARDGVSLRIESGCGRAAGFHDEDYAGVEVFDDFDGVVAGADLVVKVRMPTLEEIGALAPGTVLVTLTRTFAHVAEIEALARGKITTIAMDLVPRTARARSMDALSSQATVAGYKAALLAAELSPRLFPMMTTAAGTIRPSRVVVIGAGVAGLQAIATARRLGAEVEAYDIRARARERIESLGARMIDTGVEGTDSAGRARALRKDELQRQDEVLAERLARAHAVICAASIPNRPAPRIVSRQMVEGMLSETVIVDVAASSGGNCELTRPGENVQLGGTLVAGPLNLPSHGAVHASEMYARNVTNLLALVLGAGGEIVLDAEDDIVARCVLTHQGEICHAATAALMERPVRPFGGGAAGPGADEEPDGEAGWVTGAADDADRRGVPRASERASGAVVATIAENGEDPDDGPSAEAGDAHGVTRAPEPSSGGTGATNSRASGTTGGTSGDAGRASEMEHGARATRGVAPGSSSTTDRHASSTAGNGASVGGMATGKAPAGDGGEGAPERAAPTARRRGSREDVDAVRAAASARDASDAGDSPAPEEPPDDLTVIDGIGPALQERLYAFGYTRLAMLADLDEPERRRLAVQLELDEEIEEADWSGQARARLGDQGRTEGMD